MSDKGVGWQITGCIIGTVAIFVPSALVGLSSSPIWNNLKKYAIFFRALKGSMPPSWASMVASAIYMLKDISLASLGSEHGLMNIIVMLGTAPPLLFKITVARDRGDLHDLRLYCLTDIRGWRASPPAARGLGLFRKQKRISCSSFPL